jgi:hypothetical protein
MSSMRVAAVVLVLTLCGPSQAWAWGYEAHKFITEQMIALLPAELRPLFERKKAYLIERSVDPDLWRIVGWDTEDPHHFLDLDHFGAYPFAELPREYDRAVQKFGRETIHQQGLLPWRTAEFYGRLQQEFEGLKRPSPSSYAADNIVLFSAILAHYVEDGHVPLHSIVNYDGFRTGQNGVHGRWESELFERNRTRITVKPAAPKGIADPRSHMFEVLLASNKLADGVLAADFKAAAGREFYDDGYFAVFATEQLDVLQQRLNDSITAVASMIVGAWEQAGRPALPPDAPRKPRPIARPKG